MRRLDDGDGVGIEAEADEACRRPGDDGVGRHILHHDSAGADDGAAAYPGAAGGDDGVVADPDAVFDELGAQVQLIPADDAEFGEVEIGVGAQSIDRVVGIKQAGGAGDRAVAADAGARGHAPAIEGADGVETDIDVVVAPEIFAQGRAFIFVAAVQANHDLVGERSEETHHLFPSVARSGEQAGTCQPVARAVKRVLQCGRIAGRGFAWMSLEC